MSDASHILVVDDDIAVGKVLAALLMQEGFKTSVVTSAAQALTVLGKQQADLVISDVRMPGMDGLALLKAVQESSSDVPVVLMTAHGTLEVAMEAIRHGASDFMLKPFTRDEVLFVVKKALQGIVKQTQRPPAIAARAPSSSSSDALKQMIGASASLAEVKELIARAAPSNATVLILGETGTGKELAARAIHALSPRAAKPFVRVNCGALPDSLFESELFGYEKGAFTGAVARKPGRVELAEGGTLFLDEVGELSAGVQVKLLRLLQEREYERLGGTETLRANIRLVAATHRNLAEMVAAGTFREDLLYRLNVVPISLPALRERAADIPALASHFASSLGSANGRVGFQLDADALAVLAAQPWQGNIRQLQNFIERLVVLTPGMSAGKADVERELARTGGPARASSPSAVGGEATLTAKRSEAEREALSEALQQSKGNRAQAARLLGISRRTLYNKLEMLGLVDE